MADDHSTSESLDNLMKPFSWVSDDVKFFPGVRESCDVTDVACGVAAVLELIEASNLHHLSGEGRPLSVGQTEALMRLSISSLRGLEREADEYRDWVKKFGDSYILNCHWRIAAQEAPAGMRQGRPDSGDQTDKAV